MEDLRMHLKPMEYKFDSISLLMSKQVNDDVKKSIKIKLKVEMCSKQPCLFYIYIYIYACYNIKCDDYSR